jgi:hypothetical protein
MRGFLSNRRWQPFTELLVLIAGAGLIAYGTSLIFFPAGFLIGGLFLILAGIDARRS